MTMIIGMKHNLAQSFSIKEVGHFGGLMRVDVYLFDGNHWLPCALGDFLDGVEDDAVWVDRNTARLDEVKASTGDTPHEGLQGDSAVVAIDGDFVCQSRISGPDDPHVEVSPAISVQGPWTVGLVTRNTDVVKSLGKADTRPVGTLRLELQGHEATEAIQEGGRGAGSVEGGDTTETTRSPAGSRVAAGVSRIFIIVLVEIRGQRITAHISWSLVHLVGVQTDGLHGGGVVGIGAVAHGLSTATKTTTETTTERTVAIRIVHHWSLVVHYRKDGS